MFNDPYLLVGEAELRLPTPEDTPGDYLAELVREIGQKNDIAESAARAVAVAWLGCVPLHYEKADLEDCLPKGSNGFSGWIGEALGWPGHQTRVVVVPAVAGLALELGRERVGPQDVLRLLGFLWHSVAVPRGFVIRELVHTAEKPSSLGTPWFCFGGTRGGWDQMMVRSRSTKTILVLHGDLTVWEHYEERLRRADFSIIFCRSGFLAHQELKSGKRLDLVIADPFLCGSSERSIGEVAREFRESAVALRPGLPLLFMGFESEGDVLEHIGEDARVKVVDCRTKAVLPEELAQTVAEILERKQ